MTDNDELVKALRAAVKYLENDDVMLNRPYLRRELLPVLRAALPREYRCRDCGGELDPMRRESATREAPGKTQYRQSCHCGQTGQWRDTPEQALEAASTAGGGS